MSRVLGLETEYGLTVRPTTGTGRDRLSASEAAQVLFTPVERDHASSNAFLRNGGRLYLDVGSHPEYATPECLTPDRAVLADRAGDAIVARLAHRAEQVAAEAGQPVEIRLYKNNTDAHGNSYGSHENYSLHRETDLAEVARLLTPFLVTRQLICGAGHWTPSGFLISQRAAYLHDGLSAMTTRARPLINTRDEPLADPRRFRRLHVLAGDSNLSEPTLRLRLASTLAVLALVERAASGERGILPDLDLADAGDALRQLAADPGATVQLTGGTRRSAVDVQRDFAAAAAPLMDEGTHAAWVRILDAIDASAVEEVATDLEWAAKRTLLERYRTRHRLDWADRRLATVDLAFHDITVGPNGPRGLFRVAEHHGATSRLTRAAEVDRATVAAPSDTRAAIRARLIEAAQLHGRRYSVDWASFTAHDLPGPGPSEVRVYLGDPTRPTESDAEALLARLAGSWQPSGGTGTT